MPRFHPPPVHDPFHGEVGKAITVSNQDQSDGLAGAGVRQP